MIKEACFKASLLFLLLCPGIVSGAGRIPESSFSNLSTLDVGAAKGYIFIYYNARISKILNQEIESSEHPSKAIRAIVTKIDSIKADLYAIDYDPGPSGDPHFIISRQVENQLMKIGSFNGTKLIVPGEGSIYISGDTDDFFNKRRKYSLKDGTLKEVVQPYYYVGLQTITTQPIEIYTDKNYKEKVAHLPANSEVEVLIASARKEYGYDYLIRTPFGLVGWAHLDGMCGEEVVKGICFHGD